MGKTAPHIAILDDHELISASLKVALEADGYPVTVPPLTTLGEVEAALTRNPPEVALLDLDLGDFGRGEDLLPALIACGSRVIIVSGSADYSAAGRCLSAGVRGWVPKTAPFDDLLLAISKEANGEACLSEVQRERLIEAWRMREKNVADSHAPFERLTRREASVLGMLMDGKPVEQIAARSYVSVTTVRTQVRAILTKLGVNSQLEAVAMANRADWVPTFD